MPKPFGNTVSASLFSRQSRLGFPNFVKENSIPSWNTSSTFRRHFVKMFTPAQLDCMTRILSSETLCPGGRGQLGLFAIGLLVRMMRAIVTSLPVKLGKFGWLIKYNLTKFFSWMISQIILRQAIKESNLCRNLLTQYIKTASSLMK